MKMKVCGILAVIIVIGILGGWHFFLNPRSLSDRILTQTIEEKFEDGFGEWVADADVPEDPNNPGHFIMWNITRVMGPAHSGEYSLKFFIDGSQDDGTIWIERKIAVKENTQAKVNVSLEFYSESESFNTIADVCTYVGTRNPEVEEDLSVLGSANEVAGWKNYTYTTTLNTGSNGEVWVAVGITVRWEAYMNYFIDDVELEISDANQ